MDTILTSYRYPRFTKAEELALWEAMRDGCEHSRDQLIQSQIPYVMNIANKLRHPSDDIDDLIEAGMLGLIRAVDGFDATRARLSTFCTRSITWDIQAEKLRQHSRLHRPTSYHPPSCDWQWRAAGNGTALSGQELAPSTQCDLDHDDEIRALCAAIRRLPPRERMVIRSRLSGRKLTELGVEMGVCKERVRQIEMRAIAMLRERLNTTSSA